MRNRVRYVVENTKEVLPRRFGKTMIQRILRREDTLQKQTFTLFDYKDGTPATLAFPITNNGEVIAISQFRPGVLEYILELPGGIPQKDEPTIAAAKRELLEETGYESTSCVLLSPAPIWFEPSNCTWGYYAVLAVGCKKNGEQKLDSTEDITVELIPLKKWIELIATGGIRDGKSIVLTHLAMPHLAAMGWKNK